MQELPVFFKGSRYENLPTATYTDASGRTITYVSTRYIAATTAYIGYSVSDGDRLDNIAYQYFRDSQRFWRICDANLATWPEDLLVVGAVIAVPPSED
jgi:hypothetical protein